MERKRQKESYVFEKEIENIMAWKSQFDKLLDTENLQVNIISKHRENIDTRAIFPIVSRYTGALPPNTQAITFCKTTKRLSYKQCNKNEIADEQFCNFLTVRKFWKESSLYW